MTSKCNCTKCGNPISFDVEHSGETCTCPHCQYETILTATFLVKQEKQKNPIKTLALIMIGCGVLIAITMFFMWGQTQDDSPPSPFAAALVLIEPVVGLSVGIAALVGGTLLYFVPSWIALKRKKRNFTAIFVLNFFTGWTFIGWVVALTWALTLDDK